jgi:hypothetical protein
MILRVEGCRDLEDATAGDVQRALVAFGTQRGATWVILEAGDGSYGQAAGANGRFVVEVRDVFGGEGWRHWRAYRAGGGDGPAIVTYRQRCPQAKHPSRGCPLRVAESDVLGLAEVTEALLQFARDGSRHAALTWRDVSSQFRPDPDDDGDFQAIRPSPPGITPPAAGARRRPPAARARPGAHR